MQRRITHRRVDDAARRDKVERARKFIFKDGVGVEGQWVKDLLDPQSLTPIRVSFSLFLTVLFTYSSQQNMFSHKLAEHGFDMYQMMTVDLLHEFELGVWKAVFTHLLRLLYAAASNGIQQLNRR